MFTWICPKCGAEVPPSHDQCPRCAANAAATVATTPAVGTPAPPVESSSPAASPSEPQTARPIAAAPPAPAVAPTPPSQTSAAAQAATPPVRKQALSPVLAAILSAVGMLALLAVLYIWVLPQNRSTEASTETPAPLETPGPVGSSTPVHPLAKHLELTGVRIQEEKGGRARIQMIVVNHSGADLPAMKMQVTLRAADRQLFDLPVDLPPLGPYEGRDVSASVKSTLKPYEMPDWQLVKPSFRLIEEP